MLLIVPLNAEKVAVLDEVNKPEVILFGCGNIYILEGTTVYIYDESTLKFKGKFGKEGEGPGEIKKNPFSGPLLMVPYKEKVTISSMGKFSVFTKDGSFEKEFKISPMDAFQPFEDKFICYTPYAKGPGELFLAVFMADKDLKKAKEPLIVSDAMVGPTAKFLFPFSAFAPIPYKDKLYLAPDPMKFAIDVYNKDAKKIYTINKDYQGEKIPSEYKEKTIHWFKSDPTWKTLYEMFKDRIYFRDNYPPIMAILVDSAQIYVFTFNFNKKGDRECLIMDLKGKELSRVYLPFRENYGLDFVYPYNIYKNHFYIIKENIEEETWELHRIKLI
jgi:hypothetical protein